LRGNYTVSHNKNERGNYVITARQSEIKEPDGNFTIPQFEK
jgi:hypothetical protein